MQRTTINIKPLSAWRVSSTEVYCIRLLILISMTMLFSFSEIFGQSDSITIKSFPTIKVIGRAYADSIVLRWATTTPASWQHANKYGYFVERYTLVRNNEILTLPERMTFNVIKPWSLENWRQIVNKNKYAAIAAQALYGETFVMDHNSTNLVQIANKVREIESRFTFALFAADFSSEVARASGLWFTDKSVKKGEKYLYRVFTISHPEKNIKIDTGFVALSPNDQFDIPAPVQVSAAFSDKTVMLKWNREYHQQIFTAYFIERSDDGGKSFRRIDDNPIATPSQQANYMIAIDSLPQNNKIYVYRIRGVTPFGEISPPSKNIEGQGQNSLKANPSITSYDVISKKGVLVKWKFPEDLNQELKGFIVERSSSITGVYKNLHKTQLTNFTREFVDVNPENSNYYKIKALGKNGSVTESFPYLIQLTDSIPPLPPQHLSGSIDSLGLVTLKWKANSEKDLSGYRVYRANFANDEYSQITVSPLIDTVFRDTISVNNLTKSIYYKVIAVDHHANPSDFSKSLLLKRPDLIPPVAPVFTDIKSTDNSVIITWSNSSSDDVINHILYRRYNNEEVWTKLKEFKLSLPVTTYTDFDVKANNQYDYKLVAIDESNLESPPSQTVGVKMVDNGLRPPMEKIKAFVDRSSKFISLSWNYGENDIEKFMIYRGKLGEPLRLYASLPNKSNEFKDEQLIINTSYIYCVKASFTNGAQSFFSEKIIVKY